MPKFRVAVEYHVVSTWRTSVEVEADSAADAEDAVLANPSGIDYWNAVNVSELVTGDRVPSVEEVS